MTEKKPRNKTTSVVLDNIPQNFIKAKYLRHSGRVTSMAGFEAGEGEVSIITNRRTGKRQMRLTLNGFVRIEANGDCLILDTNFNRRKLKVLCEDMTERMPKDSSGKEFKTINKGPDFEVEDESIFENLDGESVEGGSVPPEAAGKKGRKPKGLVPISKVSKDEGPKEDGAEGVGGGRRPEMTGGIDLDVD